MFYLRKGLKFHNGDPVTGHDVKFSLERIMTPESISSGAAALRRAVDKIDVLDDHTVRVTTKGVIPHFAASLSRKAQSLRCGRGRRRRWHPNRS